MFTRREFLKFGSGVLALAALGRASHVYADASVPPAEPQLTKLGRVTMFGVDIYSEPRKSAKLVRKAKRDELLSLLGRVKGEALAPHNDIWFKVTDGYAYSSIVQPVADAANEPEPDEAQRTFWGEVTVPFVDSFWSPDAGARKSARLYYTGVFRTINSKQGADGVWWYQLRDGVAHSAGPWIPASALKRISPSDLTPISPERPGKLIEIDVTKQTLTALEGEKPVLFSRASTGYGKNFTPRGNYRVWRKAFGQRMIGGEGSGYYDLPGVPFPTYFTYRGIAIHGAYWHNDWGVTRSHGCINVPADVARWIWRWTLPVVPYEATDFRVRPTDTTQVRVI
jgi:lipoprotein-anchoring transpeptidase ErfK/SrfK